MHFLQLSHFPKSPHTHAKQASTLQVYLDTFLATLREQGYSIFVILGQLPISSSGDMGSGSGSWFTAAQASADMSACSAQEQPSRSGPYLRACASEQLRESMLCKYIKRPL